MAFRVLKYIIMTSECVNLLLLVWLDRVDELLLIFDLVVKVYECVLVSLIKQ